MDDTKQYLLVTDRHNDQLHIYKFKNKASGCCGAHLEAITLTEDQKVQLRIIRKSKSNRYGSFTQVDPRTKALLHNHLQTQHIIDICKEIFGQNITIATLKDELAKQYYLMIGGNKNLVVDQIIPLSVDLKDGSRGEDDSWKDLYVNRIVGEPEITISRRISNMYVERDH